MAVDLALLAVQAGSRPVGDVVGEPAPDQYIRNKKPGGNPPRVGNVVQMQKKVFSEFRWYNWAENITNQALGACFSKRTFQR